MKNAMFAITCGALLVVPGCHTFDGVGRDISALGRGVSHVANEVREEVFVADADSTRVARAGEPCDPGAGELAGGNGLPRC